MSRLTTLAHGAAKHIEQAIEICMLLDLETAAWSLVKASEDIEEYIKRERKSFTTDDEGTVIQLFGDDALKTDEEER